VNSFILQVKDGNDFETLYVYSDGRVICDSCVNGLFNKDRDYFSYCRHAQKCIKDICRGDLSDYWDVSP